MSKPDLIDEIVDKCEKRGIVAPEIRFIPDFMEMIEIMQNGLKLSNEWLP